MRTYYQVSVQYKLIHSRAHIIALSFHSSSVYYPYLLRLNKPPLSFARFFYDLCWADDYIKHLFKVHPYTTVPYPVLDAMQGLLF